MCDGLTTITVQGSRCGRTKGVKVRAPPMDRSVLSASSTSAPADHIRVQPHPCAGGAYGSSALLTGPQTEGIYGRLVSKVEFNQSD